MKHSLVRRNIDKEITNSDVKVPLNKHLSRCFSRNQQIKQILTDTRISLIFFLRKALAFRTHTCEEKKINLLRRFMRIGRREGIDSEISFGSRCDLDKQMQHVQASRPLVFTCVSAGATRGYLSRTHTHSIR